jgi:glycosyltransferase involved in cell wall biosynthesis
MNTGEGAVVVIPTYQEAANLPDLLDRVCSSLSQARIVVVDDVSGDGTPELIRRHPLAGRRLFVIERTGRRGFASALQEGYRWALDRGASVVIQMDADSSHDPADLPRLLEGIEHGAGLVIGSRYCPGGEIRNWSKWREFFSRCAGHYVRFWTGLPLRDPTAGFRAFRADLLTELLKRSYDCDGYAFQVETAHAAWKRGERISEIPVVFTERREGQSKLSMAIIRESILRIPLLSWKNGEAA